MAERIGEQTTALATTAPAAVDAPASDTRVIRLYAGDVIYELPLAQVLPALVAHVGALVAVKPGQELGKAAMIRSAIKGLLPVAIPLITGEVRKSAARLGVYLPLPDLSQRRPDNLVYLAQYACELLLALLASQEWRANLESLGGDGRHVRIASVSYRTPVVDGAADTGEASAPGGGAS